MWILRLPRFSKALLRSTKGCVLHLLELHSLRARRGEGIANDHRNPLQTLTTRHVLCMRDFGIGLSDELHRVAWRLNLRGAV